MPIYMDRHDVSEAVTAENVAHLHQEDLKIQDKFNCRGLTYWFDEKRKTAFCLIDAPDKETLKEMHDEAHGQVPHSVIEVDASIVESFLGRIEDPEKAQNTDLNIINDPAFRTIMVVELKRLTPKQNDDQVNNFIGSVLNILRSYNEKPVRQSEGGALISFKSVTGAVDAAAAIQSEFHQLNDELNGDKVLLKIGLSAGVPVTEKKLFFEEAIKLAERMCAIVDGEIIVSSEVRDLYKSENSNYFITGKNIVSLGREDEQFLNALMDYISSAWSNPNLKVDNFCKPMGYSKSQLYRKMIVLTGTSPNSFIRDYRLAKALELLNRNSGNVSEIAFETGFTSPSYFSKCFQKKYGSLPSGYLHLQKA